MKQKETRIKPGFFNIYNMAEDPKIISAIQNFSDSIEILSQAILTFVENSNQEKPEQSENTDYKDTAKSIQDTAIYLELMSDTIVNTDNTVQDIAKAIVEIKNDKKDKGLIGIFKSGKEKAQAIAGGIKDIVLMSGAILAIGSAFKVVGDVNFQSVMALALALPLVAYAFNEIGKSAKKPEETLNIAQSLVIISAAIAASGLLLSYMPALSFMQMVTAVGVSFALSVAMVGIGLAAKNIKPDQIGTIYALAPLMPIVAGAISLSAAFLSGIPGVGLTEMLTALGVGGAIALVMIPLGLAAKAVGGDMFKLAGLSLMMPLVAAGINYSAYVLSDLPDVDFMGLVELAGAITGAIIIAGTGMWLLQKLGVNIGTAIQGVLVMPVIAAGIALSSQILSLGNYKDGPTLEWAKGFGLSMIATIPVVVVYGALIASGFGIPVVLGGIVGMLAVGAGLAAVSHILATGDYSNAPSVEWSMGVGMALAAFTNAITALKPNVFDMIFSNDTMASKIGSIITIGEALKQVADVIRGGNYTGGPTVAWSMGVGIALMTFANALNAIKPTAFERFMGASTYQNIRSIITLAKALPEIGAAIGKDQSVYTGGPKKEWSEGVGIALMTFVDALVKLNSMNSVFGPKLPQHLENMILIAGSLQKIGEAVGTDQSMYTGGPEKEWSERVGSTLTIFVDALTKLQTGGKIFEQVDDMVRIARSFKRIGRAIGKDQSMYVGGPTKDWAEATGENILIFSNVLSKLKFDDDLYLTIDNMVRIAKSFKRVGWAVGKSADIYSGGPTVEWSEQITQSVNLFGKSFYKLSNDVSPETVITWVEPMQSIAELIKYFAMTLKGQDFKNYPSEDWTAGILGFMNGVSNWNGSSNILQTTKNIRWMARANFMLARSIRSIAYSVKTVDKVPDLTNLYSGLVALSVIDSSNLNKVLDQVSGKQDKFKDLLKVVNVEYSGNNFGAGYSTPNTPPPSSGGSSSSGSSSNSNVKTEGKTEKKPEVAKKTEQVQDKSLTLMQQLVSLQSQMNTLLGEIADNTSSQKINKVGISH